MSGSSRERKICAVAFKSSGGPSYHCQLTREHLEDHLREITLFSESGKEAKLTITWPRKNNMGWMKTKERT